MPVIYKATNRINNKSYIGFAINFEDRKRRHRYNSEKNKHNQYFLNALRKHGWDNFEWSILKENATLIDETYYILSHETYWETGKGYNLTMGGEGKLGYKTSNETKMKLTEKAKNRVVTEDRILILKNNAQNMKGRPRSEEDKKKISAALKGRTTSEAAKKNISLGHAAYKETGKFYKSEEYKEKMSQALKGKKRTPEQRERYRQAALNRSKEHQEKINASLKNTHSRKMP